MAHFEYKVIPAPVTGKAGKGVKGHQGRFANALAEAINEQAQSGWEYVRAESLPSVERSGITRKRTESYQNMLVFKRETEAPEETEQAEQKSAFNPFKRFRSKEFAGAGAAEVLMTTPKPEETPEPEVEEEPELEDVLELEEPDEEDLVLDEPQEDEEDDTDEDGEEDKKPTG